MAKSIPKLTGYSVTNKSRQLIPIMVKEGTKLVQKNLPPKETIVVDQLTDSIINLSHDSRKLLEVKLI